MTGIELLERVARARPRTPSCCCSRRTPTPTSRSAAINDIGLDYYLLKPWDPPEDRLYPVVDDLLGDWRDGAPRRRRPTCGWSATGGPSAATRSRRSWPATTCPTAGSTSSATTRRAGCVELAGARARRPAARAGARRRAAALPDHASSSPTRSACAPAPSSRSTTCASSAAVRPGSPPRCTPPPRGCSTVVVEREAPGGQAGQSAAIENYLGFPKGLSGADLDPPGGRPGAAVRRRDGAGPRRRRPRDARARCTPCCFDGGGEIEARARARRDRRLLPAARGARARRAHRPRRLLRRDRQRGRASARATTSTSSARPTRPARRR